VVHFEETTQLLTVKMSNNINRMLIDCIGMRIKLIPAAYPEQATST